jgi:hypothetical protein
MTRIGESVCPFETLFGSFVGPLGILTYRLRQIASTENT